MNQHIINFKKYLQLAGMAPRTIAVYCGILKDFLNFVEDPYFATTQNLIDFALLKNSPAARKQTQGVFKHFFKAVVRKPEILVRLPQIKHQQKLPEILSEVEAQKVIVGLLNIKHRAILSLIYHCALRVSEAINLKISDVNGTNSTIHIKQSKGAKDRVVPIPIETLQLLRAYFLEHRPKVYLFNSYKKGMRYSPKSIQKVLHNAVTLQQINKKITPHCLRHSRATHLLNNGLDIKFVKEMLGHANIKTTERYLHLTVATMQQNINTADQNIKKLIAAA